MTNEEKAKELANEYQDYIHKCKINLQLENQSKEEISKHCVKAAAIEMAEWKDQQINLLLDAIDHAYLQLDRSYGDLALEVVDKVEYLKSLRQ